MKKFFKLIFTFFLNICTPKHKNRIYIKHETHKDKVDIINNGQSNLLFFLDKYVQRKREKKIVFYIEYRDEKRKDKYLAYAESIRKNNIVLCFLKDYKAETNKIKRFFIRLNNLIKRYSCYTWMCESGDAFVSDLSRLPCQKTICFNYFISCKNDLILKENFRWAYLEKMVTTSFLASQILSASIGVKLDKCWISGFPRNDTLFQEDKKDIILNWVRKKVGYVPKFIILYVPTYREYESGVKQPAFFSEYTKSGKRITTDQTRPNRDLLGYTTEDFSLFLKEKEAVCIYSLHPLQPVEKIFSNTMIAYEDNYEFTLYDLMAMADCLISDYSSISYDFLLLDRPLIFNLYDMEKYIQMRGVSYDPFEEFCPGAIVKNWDEMKKALIDVVEGVDEYKEHRARVRKLLHKYSDGNSTDRVIAYFDEYLKNLLG